MKVLHHASFSLPQQGVLTAILDEFVHRQELAKLQKMKEEVRYCAMPLILFSFNSYFLYWFIDLLDCSETAGIGE